MMKKRLIIFIMLIILFATSATIGAFLTDSKDVDNQFDVGFVEVDLLVDFKKDGLIKSTNLEPQLDQTHVKKGVYRVDITDSSDMQFIENLRVRFEVKSSVDTYFRFKMYQSLVIKTVNTQGVVSEYAIKADFDYNMENDFYVHTDGYVYYKNKVKRNSDHSPYEIYFIAEYFEGQIFNAAPLGQELQISFDVEAVQANGGAFNNWGLITPPWGGSWS